MANPIRQYRKDRKLSRAEFARRAGCSVSFVGHLERGIRKLSPEMALDWETRLEIPRHKLRADIWKSQEQSG